MNGYSVEDDIAFHLNPRVGEGQVVMNCCMGGGWGEEEREDIPSPIANREPFEVKVVVKKKKFKVWLLILYLINIYKYIFIVLKYYDLIKKIAWLWSLGFRPVFKTNKYH